MEQFYLQPIMNVVAIAAMGVALLLLLLVRPTFRSVTPARRTTLAALRLGVVVLVVTAMLRPSCIRTTTQPQSAVLLILLDQSRSMQLPHESGGTSRWEKQIDTLRANLPLLSELKDDLDIDVKVFAYDTELHRLTFDGDEIAFPVAADGDLTDIGSPLDEAVAGERSRRLVGVVLMGDGVQTAHDQRIEVIDAVEKLNDLQHPLWTIAFGPEGDVQQAADVAVVYFPDQPYSVFVKNELVVRGTVRIRSFANIEVPVELIVERTDGSERKVVDTKKISTPLSEGDVNVELTYVPTEPGQYKLTLRAVPLENEDITKNNELSTFLTVFEGGLRVLYLEGDLRLEQKFLRQSIDSSQDIELDFQWIDHRLRDRWPVNLADKFRDPQYDLFIIGDLDSRALFKEGTGEENLAALVEAVDRGKGLIMLGGYHSFGPGRYHSTPLADVLPVKMDKLEAQDFGTRISESLHVNEKLQMMPADDHYLMHLAPGGENLSVWQSLPPLDGANRLVAKDTVEPLAIAKVKEADGADGEKETEVDLLIAGNYGDGRVLAFAGDSTWRWWMQGHRDQHRRFWRQIILWLAKREDMEQGDVWVKLPQRRFQPGAQIDFRTGAKSPAGDVVSNATFTATVAGPDGAEQSVLLSPDGAEGTGRIDDATQAGTYTIEVTARNPDGKSLGSSKAQFMIYDHDIEKSNAAANPTQMRLLANITAESGGRPIAPEQLTALLEEIKRTPPELKIEIPQKWTLGDTWRDAWLFFLVVVTLLTVEWALRKKWGLV